MAVEMGRFSTRVSRESISAVPSAAGSHAGALCAGPSLAGAANQHVHLPGPYSRSPPGPRSRSVFQQAGVVSQDSRTDLFPRLRPARDCCCHIRRSVGVAMGWRLRGSPCLLDRTGCICHPHCTPLGFPLQAGTTLLPRQIKPPAGHARLLEGIIEGKQEALIPPEPGRSSSSAAVCTRGFPSRCAPVGKIARLPQPVTAREPRSEPLKDQHSRPSCAPEARGTQQRVRMPPNSGVSIRGLQEGSHLAASEKT